MQNKYTDLAATFDGDYSSIDKNVLNAICGEPWAITEDGLNSILAIVSRSHTKDGKMIAFEKPVKPTPVNGTKYTQIVGDTGIINVIGPISRYANMFSDMSGATTIDGLVNDLNTVMNDPTVKQIVLNIDSPGGQVTGISEFASMIKDYGKTKEIIAYVSGMGASAAYWIASQASKIIVSDTAIVGSIGVIMTFKEGQDAGIQKIRSSQSPNKQPSLDTKEGKSLYQVVVDELAAVFINAVASGRGVDQKTVVENFGKGGVVVGVNAVHLGMVDGVNTFNAVISGKKPGLKSEVKIMSEENKTPVLTLDSIKVLYPAIAQALITEGVNSVNVADAAVKGVAAENARIKAIEALAMPGHDALIASMKFDSSVTPEIAAVRLINAENARKQTAVGALAADGAISVPVATAPVQDVVSDNLLTPAQAWEKMNAADKAEYENDYSIFESCVEAEKNGLVKIYTNKR